MPSAQAAQADHADRRRDPRAAPGHADRPQAPYPDTVAEVDLLAARLRTPLQIEQHLTLALETGYHASEKPVGEGIVDPVLSK